MSGHCWPFLTCITVLYLSFVSSTNRNASIRQESGGINSRDQPYSQGAPLSVQNRGGLFHSEQPDGLNGVGVTLDIQNIISESGASEKGASNRAVSDAVPNERAGTKRAARERVNNIRAVCERTASKRVGKERVISKRAINEKATNKKATDEKEFSNRATTERVVRKKATSKRATRYRSTTDRAAIEFDKPLCAYRVLEEGEEGQLCFRLTQMDFTCPRATCLQVRSPGGQLVANMLSNGSVLLQWAYSSQSRTIIPGNTGVPSETPELTVTPPAGGATEALPASQKSQKQGQQEGGFKMSCWWNGSYTQFECSSVILASSCRDFLLTELHENVPYRICLQPLWAIWDKGKTGKLHGHKPKTKVEVWDGSGCVEFIVSPSGMQDIVIAMTTVGGAICVMLVIICLLVAYITENIMSPAVQHTLTARHSTRSHNTHL
ncbi:uncharacterized protein fndc10 [Hoplias malabaricus]|uniref:uncharacterized protein fndc10 n=1 Tax=Hoplias malabaricus TaxID=27720 RepID=UPI003461E573